MIENLVPSAWQGGYPNQYDGKSGYTISIPESDTMVLCDKIPVALSQYRFVMMTYIGSYSEDKFFLVYDFVENTIKGIKKYSATSSFEFVQIDGTNEIVEINITNKGWIYFQIVQSNGYVEVTGRSSSRDNDLVVDIIVC